MDSVKKILFVTGNSTKVIHANFALRKFGYEVYSKKVDIVEPREEDPEKVVVEKALQAIEKLKTALIVEDSGIFISALNGFPKTYVHFVEDTVGIKGVLKLMEGISDRNAEFRQSLAYIKPGMGTPKVFSYVDGGYKVSEKVFEPVGDADWNDFDKILIPPGEEKPICMFSKKENAERDAEHNKGSIHYEQLARWLVQGD